MVGIEGASAERDLIVIASALSFPAFTSGMTEVRLGKPSCTWPVTTSRFAAAMPLYGTCVSFTPVVVSSSAPAMCAGEPLPDELKLSCPGRVLANASSSFTVAAGTDGLAMKRSGVSPTSVIGWKSLDPGAERQDDGG